MQRAQSDDKARHASLRAVIDATELDVSIDGQPLAHRLYHFCLECPAPRSGELPEEHMLFRLFPSY